MLTLIQRIVRFLAGVLIGMIAVTGTVGLWIFALGDPPNAYQFVGILILLWVAIDWASDKFQVSSFKVSSSRPSDFGELSRAAPDPRPLVRLGQGDYARDIYGPLRHAHGEEVDER